MSATRISAQQDYQQWIDAHRTTISHLEKTSRRLISARVASALPGLGLIIFGIAEPSVGNWVWMTGVLLIVLFLGFATWYEYVQWSLAQRRLQLFGLDRLVARCNRDWGQLEALPHESDCEPFFNDWTHDLDIFGARSLFRWFSLAMTRTGTQTVARWLTEWASTTTISDRQAAVSELVLARDWRLSTFQITCGLRNQRSNPESIRDWCEAPRHFHDRPWILWLTRIGPWISFAGLVVLLSTLGTEANQLQLAGLIALLTGLAINLLLTMSIVGPVHDLFHRIGAANRELAILRDWIQAVGDMPKQSNLLNGLAHSLSNESSNAGTAIRKLQTGMALAGIQRSPIMFIPYVVLQLFFLWDIRILMRLEHWKRQYGPHANQWLSSLGELEALFSAAFASDENSDWTLPRVLERGALLSVEGMAHPLLKISVRVPNSLTIQDRQKLLLVTGSNMAGKSTLLRSVGVNSVLMRTGSTVCAASWTSESFELASSIRVQDSLQDGVSFFMAELKRLRRVVDDAQKEHSPNGKRMLILLDEILQGTNSRERQIAVETVLKKLIELDAMVMASTHDLELANNEQMAKMAQIVHFREYFELVDGKQQMKFDYKMREGVTPTTNALKLLEMVGL